MSIRARVTRLKESVKRASPPVRLIMEPIPALTVDEWEALSQKHHEKMLQGGGPCH